MDNQAEGKIKFSIITASFNSEKTIEATFRSIIDQSYNNLEYIVIDGNSSDGTVDLIKQYESKFKEAGIDYKWISEKDDGIYDAWNKGLEISQGDWVGFIGSDDVYQSYTFSLYAKYILENPEMDFISAKTKMVRNGKVIRIMGEEWNWQTFKREMKVGHAGAIHNKKYFEKYGNFNSDFKITGDYELLLRAKEKLKVGFINDCVAIMGGDGVSSTLVMKTLSEAKRAKVESGVKNYFQASIEMYFVYVKIVLKSLYNKLFFNGKVE